MTKIKKPTDKIRSPQKISVGLVSLLLMLMLVFVFFEDRQRGLALLISIALVVCLIYFTYLYVSDRDSLNRHRKYLSEIRKIAEAKDDKYEFSSKSEMLVPNPGETKNFVLIMTALVFVVALAMLSTRSRIGGLGLILDVILLAAYVWLENQESKLIEEEINYIENKYPA